MCFCGYDEPKLNDLNQFFKGHLIITMNLMTTLYLFLNFKLIQMILMNQPKHILATIFRIFRSIFVFF